MFPQHTLIISILTWLWTGPATLTAFDALLLFFLRVTISSSTRQRHGFVLYSFAVFFLFLLTKATWALCKSTWWKHLVVLRCSLLVAGNCSGLFTCSRSKKRILHHGVRKPVHNNPFIIIASVFLKRNVFHNGKKRQPPPADLKLRLH